MILLISFLLVLPAIVFWFHSKQKAENAKIGLPMVDGWPIIGSVFSVTPYAKQRKLFEYVQKCHEKYGDTYIFRVGGFKHIINRDPKITEAIVNNPNFGKAKEYDLLGTWLGNGLVVSSGEKWHKMRKLATPAFHFSILERFISIFDEKVNVMVELIKKYGDNEKVFDILPMSHKLTLDIIAETSMGVNLNAQNDDQHNKFMEANNMALDIILKRIFNVFLQIPLIFRCTSLHNQFIESVNYINNFIREVIEKRREKLLTENNNKNEDEDEYSTKNRPALLDILLEAQKTDKHAVTDEDIQAEVKTFMFAGHDTTANVIGFVTYLLAKHPEIQSKVWNEIKSNKLNVKTNLSMRDLGTLSYMDTVIKETLRLYPPAPMISKCCHEDVKIGDVYIPAKMTIVTSIHAGHHNEKYFENPEEFNPDRFNKEISSADRNPYVYQPFSAGLRNCIGQKFAQLELKTALVRLLSAFELRLSSDDFEPDLWEMGTLNSRNGIQLRVKSR